jgi:hypothetical protein
MERKLNICVYTTLAILLGYLIWNFISKESRNFSSLNYAWTIIEIIKNFELVSLDSISDEYLRIKTSNKLELKPQNTFKLENEKGAYYFRYTYSIIESDGVIFKGLIWLNSQPKFLNEKFDLIEIILPISETKGVDFITIGDEQLYQNEAKYFRKELRRRKNVNFLGAKKDIYGFNYSGDKSLSFKQLNTNYTKIPKAQYFVIMLRPKDEVSIAFANLQNVVLRLLAEEKTKKVILITQPVYQNTHQSINDFNKNLVNFSKQEENVVCIDLKSIFIETPSYYRVNINEISKAGYERLAKEVSQLF